MVVKNAFGDLALEETQLDQNDLLELLSAFMQHVGVLSAVRETNGSLRVSVTNTHAVTVTGTLTTVSTVTSLANQAANGGQPTQQVVPAAQNTLAHLANVAVVVVTP